MKKLGIVGWRGMVGSVLIGRMQEEQDFANVETTLFSTSQAGEARNYARAAGMVTGLTQPPRCAWTTARSSSLTR